MHALSGRFELFFSKAKALLWAFLYYCNIKPCGPTLEIAFHIAISPLFMEMVPSNLFCFAQCNFCPESCLRGIWNVRACRVHFHVVVPSPQR